MSVKTITVPLSRSAMIALDYDEADDFDLMEFTLSDSEFYQLWPSGFFAAVNAGLGTLIGDFEDEKIIDPAKLVELAKIIANHNERSAPVVQIERLVRCAIEQQTGVFFFF